MSAETLECRARDEKHLAPVDIVVPVYGAAEALERCLESVVRHTDLAEDRLVVVLDGPQDAEVEAVVARFSDGNSGQILVEKRPQRRGFVASVNHGMALSVNDVVLLNSDAVVSSNWLDNLVSAAYSRSNIATVTPWSNNATLCSVPLFLADNQLPVGYDVDRFAALVASVTARRRPEIPTGVGVCLLIRRSALEQVGLFDEQAFGFGYGEESDFCARATARGLVHLLDDASFVFHLGQGSFGADRTSRVKKAHRIMRRRHPDYLPRIADFIRKNPLAPLRAPILEQLRPQPAAAEGGPKSLLVVCERQVEATVEATDESFERCGGRSARRRSGERANDHRVTLHRVIEHPKRSPGDVIEQIDRGARVRSTVVSNDRRVPTIVDRQTIELIEDEAVDLVHILGVSTASGHLITELDRRQLAWVLEPLDDDLAAPDESLSRFGSWLAERRARRVVAAANGLIFSSDARRRNAFERFSGIESKPWTIVRSGDHSSKLQTFYRRLLDDAGNTQGKQTRENSR